MVDTVKTLALKFIFFCVLIILPLLVVALSYLRVVGTVGTVPDVLGSVLFEFVVLSILKRIGLTSVNIF